MRMTRNLVLAAISVVLIAACHDNPAALDAADMPEVTWPEAPRPDITAYADREAVSRYRDILQAQLDDPELLELNATFRGISVEEQKSQIFGGLEKLDQAVNTLFASSACGANPQFFWRDTSIAVLDPLFPGWHGEMVVSGFTISTQPAVQRIYTYGESGGGFYLGPGSITYENHHLAGDTTSAPNCVTSWLAHTATIYIYPNYAGRWWAYGESMHEIRRPGQSRLEEYTSVVVEGCWPPEGQPFC